MNCLGTLGSPPPPQVHPTLPGSVVLRSEAPPHIRSPIRSAFRVKVGDTCGGIELVPIHWEGHLVPGIGSYSPMASSLTRCFWEIRGRDSSPRTTTAVRVRIASNAHFYHLPAIPCSFEIWGTYTRESLELTPPFLGDTFARGVTRGESCSSSERPAECPFLGEGGMVPLLCKNRGMFKRKLAVIMNE